MIRINISLFNKLPAGNFTTWLKQAYLASKNYIAGFAKKDRFCWKTKKKKQKKTKHLLNQNELKAEQDKIN